LLLFFSFEATLLLFFSFEFTTCLGLQQNLKRRQCTVLIQMHQRVVVIESKYSAVVSLLTQLLLHQTIEVWEEITRKHPKFRKYSQEQSFYMHIMQASNGQCRK
jgi:hypothetical protein